MSLPLLHAGRTNPGLSAALDLRFALDKSLTAYRGPTPSFSRASTGSYFDGSGVLRYASINVQSYSEDFSNAYWAKANSSVLTDQTASPDGKNTADKLVENSSTAFHQIYNTGFSTTSGSPATISVYVKTAGRQFVQFYISSNMGNGYANFDIVNGTLGTVSGTGITAAITNVGNGWFRISASQSSCTTGTAYFQLGTILTSTSTQSQAHLGDGVSGVFIWGAQGELSSTVGTYVPTTSSANSAPRFDHVYNGTSWISRGLLVEEQRTNLLQYSESFNTTPYWQPASGASVTANQTVAPDGNTTADNVAGVNGFYQNSAGMGSSTATNTGSIFAKANGSSEIKLRINEWGSGTNFVEGTFNLSTGAATATNGGSGSGATASMVNVGNGWYRCIIAGKPSTTAGTCGFYPYGMTTSVYCWGAQFETGASFASSYIPSVSNASTTRSADVCQITGGDFSSFWNGTEGTLACEFDRLSSVTSSFSSGFPHAVSLVDSGNLVRQGFYGGHSGASPTGEIFLYNGSGRITAGALVSGTSPIKISGAYKASDFAGSLNGATAVTSSSGSIDPVVQMNIGAWASSQYMLNGHIARLRYFNKRLPNATLQQLSEPDPTLNLQFALNKTLTPVAGPAPSFSRASTGTYFNASGVLTSASINTPRFDHVYSGGQWVSRGLLIEEQRTNVIQQSEDLTNAVWLKGNVTVSGNQAVSPDGTQDADLVYPASSGYRYIESTIIDSGTGSVYTASVYAKAAGVNWITINGLNDNTSLFTWFNISNGTIGTVGSGVTATITNVGNGWYRCTVSRARTGTVYTWFNLCDGNNDTNVTASGTNGVYLWGAQRELGSFPTSYIPTTTTSVVRSADVCQITGTSFSWMWNQGEGSVFTEFDTNAPSVPLATSGFNTQIFAARNSSNNQRIYLGTENFGGRRFYIDDGAGSSSVISPGALIGNGVINKASVAWKTNDMAASFDGASVLTDNSQIIPTGITQIDFGKSPANTNYLCGHIAKLIYYPARLTNTKLQQLST